MNDEIGDFRTGNGPVLTRTPQDALCSPEHMLPRHSFVPPPYAHPFSTPTPAPPPFGYHPMASPPPPAPKPPIEVIDSGPPWTAEDDESLLKYARESSGRSWKHIARQFSSPTRTEAECMSRWKTIIKPGAKGPWTPEEDEFLYGLVLEYGPSRWTDVAREVNLHIHAKEGGGRGEAWHVRTGKQCRERWCNHLDPTIRRGAWSAEEDAIIIQRQNAIGNKWAEIAKALNGRTENSVKNRFNSLMRKNMRAIYASDGSVTLVPPNPAAAAGGSVTAQKTQPLSGGGPLDNGKGGEAVVHSTTNTPPSPWAVSDSSMGIGGRDRGGDDGHGCECGDEGDNESGDEDMVDGDGDGESDEGDDEDHATSGDQMGLSEVDYFSRLPPYQQQGRHGGGLIGGNKAVLPVHTSSTGSSRKAQPLFTFDIPPGALPVPCSSEDPFIVSPYAHSSLFGDLPTMPLNGTGSGSIVVAAPRPSSQANGKSGKLSPPKPLTNGHSSSSHNGNGHHNGNGDDSVYQQSTTVGGGNSNNGTNGSGSGDSDKSNGNGSEGSDSGGGGSGSNSKNGAKGAGGGGGGKNGHGTTTSNGHSSASKGGHSSHSRTIKSSDTGSRSDPTPHTHAHSSPVMPPRWSPPASREHRPSGGQTGMISGSKSEPGVCVAGGPSTDEEDMQDDRSAYSGSAVYRVHYYKRRRASPAHGHIPGPLPSPLAGLRGLKQRIRDLKQPQGPEELSLATHLSHIRQRYQRLVSDIDEEGDEDAAADVVMAGGDMGALPPLFQDVPGHSGPHGSRPSNLPLSMYAGLPVTPLPIDTHPNGTNGKESGYGSMYPRPGQAYPQGSPHLRSHPYYLPLGHPQPLPHHAHYHHPIAHPHSQTHNYLHSHPLAPLAAHAMEPPPPSDSSGGGKGGHLLDGESEALRSLQAMQIVRTEGRIQGPSPPYAIPTPPSFGCSA